MSKSKGKEEPKEESKKPGYSIVETRKAFSIERVKDGWSFVAYTIENGKIVDVDRSEPDLKAVILEKFKIASFKYWSSIG